MKVFLTVQALYLFNKRFKYFIHTLKSGLNTSYSPQKTAF